MLEIYENLKAGYHNVTWNGTFNNGNNATSGIYFYRIGFGETSVTNRMTLIK